MATIRNLIIDQGSTFGAIITISNDAGNPFVLTDYTAEAQMRRSPTSQSPAAIFTCDIVTPEEGKVAISLTDEETMVLKPGRYVYDLYVEDIDGRRYRAIEGIVTVTPTVTR